MKFWATLRTFVTGAVLLAPISAVHATSVSFTDASWDEGTASYIPTITSIIDGIGIGNDEITPGGNQSPTVAFDDGQEIVSAINLLDSFATKGIDSFATEGKGEKAVAIPIPSAVWMFATALIGFVAMSRRIKV